MERQVQRCAGWGRWCRVLKYLEYGKEAIANLFGGMLNNVDILKFGGVIVNYLELIFPVSVDFPLQCKGLALILIIITHQKLTNTQGAYMQNEFPRSVQLGDVRKIGDELGTIDIITGGFPCQTFSIAGARRGFEDTRGTLFFDIARLADIYKPSIWSWRTSKGYSITMGEIPSELFWTNLEDLTITSKCYCLTLKTSCSAKQRKGVLYLLCSRRT